MRSIQEMESALGANDGALIQPLANLAQCENLSSNSNQAEILARRAAAISSKTFGERNPIAAAAMLEQASALHKLGHKREARRLEKQANMSLRSSSAASLSRYTVGFGQLAELTRR